MHRTLENDDRKTRSDHQAKYEHLPAIALPKRLPAGAIPIADMANFFGVTHRTLHFYEEKGLLNPERIGAMRVYSHDQIRIMGIVNLCRETGMPIAQIQDLMADLQSAKSSREGNSLFRDALQARRGELVAEQSLIRRQMQQINQFLEEDEEKSSSPEPGQPRTGTPFLAEREEACLKLMAEGYTTVRIAKALDADLDKILATEAKIIHKFGASNRFQAVAKAVLLGMLGE